LPPSFTLASKFFVFPTPEKTDISQFPYLNQPTMRKALLNIFAAVLVLTSCNEDPVTTPGEVAQPDQNASATSPAGRAATTCSIDLANIQQPIRGFGGSSAWHGQLTDADCDKLFTTLGLSILRVRIDPDRNWADEIANARKAVARGAIVFASPWSPPPAMKDNGSAVGGSLLPSNYSAYANWLNDFSNTMTQNGVPLYAISIQNEPNINVTYESCTWTSDQMKNFIVNNAGTINTRVMMPETFNYLKVFADPILNDPAGNANTDIAAYHWYGANRFGAWDNATSKGKDIWMTEFFSNDQSLNASIATAVDIHKFLTLNRTNAYVWWWMKNPDCNIITDTEIYKRGYVLGQFAKFVRPGYNRVETVGGSNISAFTNGTKAVVVAINTGTGSVTQTFTFQNGTVTSVTPHITSGTKNLSPQASVNVTGGSFTYTLEPKSVTTFVQN
jgi:glucuronoarabinoxylan endo-1,4-beta-xylanase